MKNRYVVRKTLMDGTYLYLNPEDGFSVEMCGIYTFTSKKTAKESLKYCNFNLYSSHTLKDEILTYDEYLASLDSKLDQMEKNAKVLHMETHRECHKLYLYLSSELYGKPIANWIDVSNDEPNCIEKYFNKYFNY